MASPESLSYFRCKACNEKRPDEKINTFKHPLIDKTIGNKIIGYQHFNYCYDNLVCYVMASRLEYFKDDTLL